MLNKVGQTQKSTDDEELDFPDVNRDGRAQAKSWENVEVFLDWTEAEIRRNEFTGNDEIDGKPLNDDLLISLVDQAHRVGLRVGQDFLLERLRARALANKYHPVRKFFKELEWDGKKRLDTWLTTYLGVLDSEYTRAVGAITLIAAVRRIRKPGVKFDTLLVIEGHQGIGKSTALSDLAVKKEWFTDCASLKHDSKTVIEQTSGKMIVEIPELSGMRKAEVEHVKANLSRTSDRSRLAYARLVSDVPRQFIMIGTINADARAGYLKDHTGNRRFWPVRAHKVEKAMLRRDVKQLWAEAALREKEGDSIVLPKDLWRVAAAKQQSRMEVNPYFLALQNQLGDREGKILTEDIWEALGKKAGMRQSDDERKMGQAMRQLGFERKQVRFETHRTYCYVKGSGEWIRLNANRRLG